MGGNDPLEQADEIKSAEDYRGLPAPQRAFPDGCLPAAPPQATQPSNDALRPLTMDSRAAAVASSPSSTLRAQHDVTSATRTADNGDTNDEELNKSIPSNVARDRAAARSSAPNRAQSTLDFTTIPRGVPILDFKVAMTPSSPLRAKCECIAFALLNIRRHSIASALPKAQHA